MNFIVSMIVAVVIFCRHSDGCVFDVLLRIAWGREVPVVRRICSKEYSPVCLLWREDLRFTSSIEKVLNNVSH